MSTPRPPQIRTLRRDEIEAILARNHVGRIAYAKDQRIDIEPIHYVYDREWIYGRTSQGTKLRTVGEGWYNWWPVAFEVDEVEDLFRWRSVVLHGGFHTIPADGAAWEETEWKRGVELLRRLIPETFTEADPAPFRSVLFRIAAQEVSGREAVPGSGEGEAP